jgi:putative DNA primase/helicase
MGNSNKSIALSCWPDIEPINRKKPASTISNLIYLLNHLNIQVKYNVISKDLEISDPGEIYGAFDGGRDAAINAIISQCAKYGLPTNNIPGFLDAIGFRNKYNPVLDWIKSKPYDNDLNYVEMLCATIVPRIDFDVKFKDLLIKKWLLSCVAMLCNDDAKYWCKGVLTFQSPQNLGKTSWFWKLFPDNHGEWGAEGVTLNPSDKDSVLLAISNWIVELGELDATFNKSDISRLKGFLTLREDNLRTPYSRKKSTFPRRTSFFASVNPPEFLRDDTGNSRFWVIPVSEINYRHNINVQQMWAQVYQAYLSGLQWYLTQDESVILDKYNEYARELHPIEEKIISGMPWMEREVTATEMLYKIGYEKPTKSERNACAAALRKHFGDSVTNGKRRVFILK